MRCFVMMLVALATALSLSGNTKAGDYTAKGIRLRGRVQVADSFPDLKVQIVDAFPDLKVLPATHRQHGNHHEAVVRGIRGERNH